jgi:hypothetical protein
MQLTARVRYGKTCDECSDMVMILHTHATNTAWKQSLLADAHSPMPHILGCAVKTVQLSVVNIGVSGTPT